ncbi:hypothetical protein ACG94X_02410 [Acinetobacter sp. ULE_I010]|uniref:hypothetical protein n=1 Tax=Acinetobacter sp. ULE_I010 TaxID=3373065 RepID=UPI003AF7ED1F
MNITEQQNDQIEATGKVSPELASQLLEAAMNGETIGQPVEPVIDTPVVNQANEEIKPTDAANTVPAEDDLNASNATVLAKDGIHTIPFESLEKARKGEQEWKAKAESYEQALAEAQSQIQTGQAITPAAEQNLATAEAAIAASGDNTDVIAMFGDFSEEAIAKGVDALLEVRVPGAIQAAIDKALQPFQQQQQLQQAQLAKSAEQQHFDAIASVHPDFESVAESQEFQNWKDAQPGILQGAYDQILNSGTSAEVNELLTLYKQANNLNVATPDVNSIKEQAKQAVSKAQTQVPHSVSDLPAGSPAGVTLDERMAAMSPAQQVEAMASWTPEQIDAYVSRNV